MAQPVRRVPRRPPCRLAPLCARYAGHSASRAPHSPAYRAQRRRTRRRAAEDRDAERARTDGCGPVLAAVGQPTRPNVAELVQILRLLIALPVRGASHIMPLPA